jgi:DNA-binding protein HU-beta
VGDRLGGVHLLKELLKAALIKQDIINAIIWETGLSRRKAAAAVESVFESMSIALGRGERIELRGFAIFDVRPRKTGIARNLHSGRSVAILPGRVVRFKPGNILQTME